MQIPSTRTEIDGAVFDSTQSVLLAASDQVDEKEIEARPGRGEIELTFLYRSRSTGAYFVERAQLRSYPGEQLEVVGFSLEPLGLNQATETYKSLGYQAIRPAKAFPDYPDSEEMSKFDAAFVAVTNSKKSACRLGDVDLAVIEARIDDGEELSDLAASYGVPYGALANALYERVELPQV